MVNLRISSYVFILQKIDIKNKTDVYKIVFRPSDEELSNDDDFGSEFKMVPKSCKRVKIKIVSLRSIRTCLLYTSPSPRDATLSRMPSSA